MRVIISALLMAALMGCVTAPTPIEPLEINSTLIDSKISKARIGDIVLSGGAFLRYKALDLKKDVHGGGGIMKNLYIPAQSLIAQSEDNRYEYYVGEGVTVHDSTLGTTTTLGGIKIIKNPTETENPVKLFGITLQTTFPKKEDPVFEKTYIDKLAKNRNNALLIFLGKAQKGIIFKYIENRTTPQGNDLDFNIEFNNEKNDIFRFKGAELKVISVSDTELTYQINSGFNLHQ